MSHSLAASSEALNNIQQHPCFNQEERHHYARIHLPVAPRCNMQCNYCNRNHSCVNESRPGVTCAVLKPRQAIEYLHRAIEKTPNLSVVGIAGPGDPFACAAETLETLSMVKAKFPQLLLCVATNGLNLLPYVNDLVSIGLSHITVTVNAVEAEIGARLYAWMEIDGMRMSGIDAAAELWRRQQLTIRALADAGIILKVNSIYVPGINDAHILRIAQQVSMLGASVLNLMPLLPTPDTPFAAIAEPARKTMQAIRSQAGKYLPQMAHCTRCRADAVGFVGEGTLPYAQQLLLQIASAPPQVLPHKPDLLTMPTLLHFALTTERPYIAIASFSREQIDQHLGEAKQLCIYRPGENHAELIEVRTVATEAGGTARWLTMIDLLHDCAGVLVSGAGTMPRKILAHYGLPVGIVEGSVYSALRTIALGGNLAFMAKPGFHCTGLKGQQVSGCA